MEEKRREGKATQTAFALNHSSRRFLVKEAWGKRSDKPLPTGPILEELDGRLHTQIHQCRSNFLSNRKPLTPILLNLPQIQKAAHFNIPPFQSEEKFTVYHLFKQSVRSPLYYSVTSEEIPLNVTIYDASSLRRYAETVCITKSAVFLLHWELCSEPDKKFTNPRLRNTYDFTLYSHSQNKAETLNSFWFTIKPATAYGAHKAVQKMIVTEKMQMTKKLKTHKRRAVLTHPQTPDAQEQKTTTSTAPLRQILRLCSTDDNNYGNLIEIVNVEDKFYPALDTIQLTQQSTHIIESITHNTNK